MYPLFETIRYKNGLTENLALHQQRVNFTLNELRADTSIVLSKCIEAEAIKPPLDEKTYKCRLQYDLTGKVNIEFEPYEIKQIHTISIQDIGNNQYPFKYSDRNWIKELLINAGTDEIIMTENGKIKDASYANLVFFDGVKWITPYQPLLMGTRRASLLRSGIIVEQPIKVKDLKNFVKLKLINAMMLWEESPIIQLL